ncbi:MAG TPA: response regulator transcription factor [Candidatus Polarisedimenticolaceae bacterium]|nr:response regulator transcription factor [Candidatus Polarisedimenticolaceae bacterium]
MTRILVLSKRGAARSGVGERLGEEGFDLLEAAGAEEARRLAATAPPDLLLIDPTLPVLEGLEICQQLRTELRAPQLPIFVLRSGGDTAERVLALEEGADDLLAEPWNPRELVARIRALLRRSSGQRTSRKIRTGTLELDLGRYTATVGEDPVKLTSKEFELLAALFEARGRVVRRQAMLDQVWGYGQAEVDSRTLDVHVHRLRKKLGREGQRIVTVRNVGHRLDLAPGWSEREARDPWAVPELT